VVGTAGPGDHFGFVTHVIGAFKLGGATILTPTPSHTDLSPATDFDVTLRALGT
jgi:hypothetical protein